MRKNSNVRPRDFADDPAAVSLAFEAIETIIWKLPITPVVQIVSKYFEMTGAIRMIRTIIWKPGFRSINLHEKNNFCHPVTLAWFSIQILVNSSIFKLSFDLSLTHLRAQIVCCELKGGFSPVMLKEISHDSFENFEITRNIVWKTMQA